MASSLPKIVKIVSKESMCSLPSPLPLPKQLADLFKAGGVSKEDWDGCWKMIDNGGNGVVARKQWSVMGGGTEFFDAIKSGPQITSRDWSKAFETMGGKDKHQLTQEQFMSAFEAAVGWAEEDMMIQATEKVFRSAPRSTYASMTLNHSVHNKLNAVASAVVSMNVQGTMNVNATGTLRGPSVRGRQSIFWNTAAKRRPMAIGMGEVFAHSKNKFGVLVLGGGPAGVKAAVEAASRGLSVGLIEPKSSVIGAPTGTHSKCLREAAMAGVKCWEEVVEQAEDTIARAIQMTARELKTFNVMVLQGSAFVKDQNTVMYTPRGQAWAGSREAQTIGFDTLVIATGSKSWRRPPTDFSLPGVFDADTIWDLGRMPTDVVVQGAGIIGIEYAVILKKLGAKSVIIVGQAPTTVDISLQKAVVETAISHGVEFVAKTTFDSVEDVAGSTPEDPKLRIKLGNGRVIDCDCFLSATGRYGCSTGFGLENLEDEGLKIGRNFFIETDNFGYTGCGKIYAVGDVAGGNLATVAQAQALRAIRHAYGSGMVKEETSVSVKPSAVWTIPELAWAGKSEDDCKKEGLKYGSVTVDVKQTLRGCVARAEKGFMKLIYEERTGQVLGIHLFGETSAENINFGAALVAADKTIYDIMKFVFPAVTYHELYCHAATEAKLRIMHGNSTKLTASVTWNRLAHMVSQSAGEKGTTVAAALMEAFAVIDVDGSGLVDLEEMKGALVQLEIELDDKSIQEMFMEATGRPDAETLDYKTFLGEMEKEEHLKISTTAYDLSEMAADFLAELEEESEEESEDKVDVSKLYSAVLL